MAAVAAMISARAAAMRVVRRARGRGAVRVACAAVFALWAVALFALLFAPLRAGRAGFAEAADAGRAFLCAARCGVSGLSPPPARFCLFLRFSCQPFFLVCVLAAFLRVRRAPCARGFPSPCIDIKSSIRIIPRLAGLGQILRLFSSFGKL